MNRAAFKIISLLFLAVALPYVNCAQQGQPASHEPVFFLHGKMSLDSLKNFVHHTSNVRFSFNSSRVKGVKEIFFPNGYYSLHALLQHIRKTTSLYYAVYNGYIVFGDHPPKSKTGKGGIPNFATKEDKQQLSGKFQSSHAIQNKGYHIGKKAGKAHISPTKKNLSAGVNKLSPTGSKAKNIVTMKVEDKVQLKNTANKISDSAIGNNKKTGSDTVIIKPLKKEIDSAVSDGNQATTAASRKNVNARNIFTGLHYGLEWNFALPFSGFKYYVSGPNAKSQPYYLLMPAFWLSREIGKKSELTLQLKLLQQYYTGKLVLNDTLISSTMDTTTITKSLLLAKTFGTQILLQYNYRISERISIGAGIGYYWQNAAVAYLQTNTETLSNKSVSDSAFGIDKSSTEWKHMKSNVFVGKIEALYNIRKIGVGICLSAPVSGFTSTNTGLLKTLNFQAIIRYKIN